MRTVTKGLVTEGMTHESNEPARPGKDAKQLTRQAHDRDL